MCGVINDRQALDGTPLGCPVEHEIHRPDQVGALRPSQGLTVRHRHLLAFAPPYLKTSFGLEPITPLVIYLSPGLAQRQVDHAGTIMAMPMRQSYDLRSQG